MCSLELCVHILELSLEEISLDFAVSAVRIPVTRSAGTTYCKLPVVDFYIQSFGGEQKITLQRQ